MATFAIIYDSASGQQVIRKVQQAEIGDGAVASGQIAANFITAVHIANQGILSANIGANIIAAPHIANQGILSANIGAGIIGNPHILAASILSGTLGANIIAAVHIVNQGILSANIGAAIIANPHIQAGGILSGAIGSGQVGLVHILSGVLTKNAMNLSGRITATDLEPGTSVDFAEGLTTTDWMTAAPVSAQAVYFSASGYINVAGGEGTNSGRLPAIGYVASGVASGVAARLNMYGVWQCPLSAAAGITVFVGSGGGLVTSAPVASGEFQQTMGRMLWGQQMFLRPSPETVQVT